MEYNKISIVCNFREIYNILYFISTLSSIHKCSGLI